MGTAQSVRVLHVDPDPAFAETVAATLADTRFVTCHEPDAGGARERLATDPVDCLLTEYDLPDTDGLALFETAREQCPGLPVVVLTGTGSEAVASRALTAGVTEYLTKTAAEEPGALEDCLDRAVRGQTGRDRRRHDNRLEEVASLVSHDLQSPLSAAIGRLELVADDCESPHLDAARRSLDRTVQFANDVATLARAGHPVEETDRVALPALVERCWEAVASPGATLTCETDVVVRADPDRLATAVESLLHNATQHAGADVTVTVGALADGFFVADDGPGIPEDRVEEVFESGYSTAGRQNGLGLALVREVARVHGWAARATDSEAGGARFEITGVDLV